MRLEQGEKPRLWRIIYSGLHFNFAARRIPNCFRSYIPVGILNGISVAILIGMPNGIAINNPARSDYRRQLPFAGSIQPADPPH